MQSRGLWVALSLALIVGGLSWWSLEEEKKKAGKPEVKADAPRILEIPADQIQRIELHRPAEDLRIVLEKGAHWTITSPQAYRADKDTADAIARTLSALDSAKLVEEKATDFAPFGFNAPRLVVKANGQQLEIADENPANGEYYARLTGQPRLYTIASFTFTALDKRVADLRDKRLVTFDSASLKTLELTAKGATLEFARNPQKDWQIAKPGTYRADGFAVEDMIRKLGEAKVDLNAKEDPASFAKGTPVASVRATDSAGVQTFELRKNKDDYFAQSSAAEGVHKLTKDLAESLDKDLSAFRAKKIFDPSIEENRVDFRDGTAASSFELKNGDWLKAGKKVENVPALVDKLRELSVLRYVETGMATPVLEATLTSAARKQKISIAKSGNMWIAQREGFSELYEIDGKAIEDLQKAAGAVK